MDRQVANQGLVCVVWRHACRSASSRKARVHAIRAYCMGKGEEGGLKNFPPQKARLNGMGKEFIHSFTEDEGGERNRAKEWRKMATFSAITLIRHASHGAHWEQAN